MKKLATIFSFIFLLTALAGCPKNTDSFMVARTTVGLARTGLVLAKTAMDSASTAQKVVCVSALCAVKHPDKGTSYEACMVADHSADETFKQCFAKMATALEVFDKSSTVAGATFNTADATITLVQSLKEQCKQKGGDPNATPPAGKSNTEDPCIAWQKVDWMPLVKRCACLAYTVMSVIPGKVQSHTVYVMIMGGLKSYGCPK